MTFDAAVCLLLFFGHKWAVETDADGCSPIRYYTYKRCSRCHTRKVCEGCGSKDPRARNCALCEGKTSS